MIQPRQRPWPIWPAVLWLVSLLVVSFLPIGWKLVLHTKGRLHDAAHVVAFAVLAFLLAETSIRVRGKMLRLVAVALLGVLIESGQDLLYARNWADRRSAMEWADILLDLMAVMLVALLDLAILPVLRRRAAAA